MQEKLGGKRNSREKKLLLTPSSLEIKLMDFPPESLLKKYIHNCTLITRETKLKFHANTLLKKNLSSYATEVAGKMGGIRFQGLKSFYKKHV